MAIKDLFVRLLFENKQFKSGMKDAGDELKDFGKKAGDTSKDAGLLGSALERYLGPAALGATVAALGKATWDLGQLGAQSLDVTKKFQSFAGGAAQAADYLDAVVNASGRAVDRMAAAEIATGMLQMGIADTTDEMSLYIEGAVRLGKQSESAGQRIDSMTQLLKNQSIEMLDNFGLSRQLILARVEQLQATQNLTREEGMLQAIQEEITRQLGILGPAAESNAGHFDVLDTAMADLKLTVAEELAPAMIDLADAATKAVDELGPLLDTIRDLGEMEDEVRWLMDLIEVLQNPTQFAFDLGEGAGGLIELGQLQQDYNAAVAESGPLSAEAASLQVQSYKRVLDSLIAERDAMLAARDAGVEVYQSHIDNINAEIALTEEAYAQARAQAYVAGAVDAGTLAYEQLRDAHLLAIASTKDLTTASEGLGKLFDKLSFYTGFAGTVKGAIPEPFLKAMSIIESEQDRLQTEMIRKAVLRGTEEERAADRATKAWEDAAEAQRRAYEDLKNTIQQALQPTDVTALDAYQTSIGQYVEKWDEAARQLDAIAERGFAEIQAHPEWVNILKIPPEILAANEDILKEWARSVSDAVRQLERPDLLNVDAAVEAVRQELARQAAVEMSLDIVAKAAIEAGVVGGVDARQQVSEALGLTQPLPVNLNLATGTQANLLQTLDAGNLGMQAGDQLLVGLRAELSTGDAIRTWTVWLNREVTTAYGGFRDVGKHAAEPVKQGFISGLTDANFLAIIAAAVSPLVAAQMDSDETYGGEY